jgi:hypothetical protein
MMSNEMREDGTCLWPMVQADHAQPQDKVIGWPESFSLQPIRSKTYAQVEDSGGAGRDGQRMVNVCHIPTT